MPVSGNVTAIPAVQTRHSVIRYEEHLEIMRSLAAAKCRADGGWRIYSSGPGIYTNIVIRHLFRTLTSPFRLHGI